MRIARRLARTLVTALAGGLLVYMLSIAFAHGDCAFAHGDCAFSDGDRYAHAQISGTTGGNVVDGQSLIEDDGIWFPLPGGATLVSAEEIASALVDGSSNTIMFGVVRFEGAARAVISAQVTVAGADRRPETTRIIAVLIGLFAPRAPGVIDMDYIDDGCALDGGGAPGAAERRACALVGRAFRAVVQARREAVSPLAIMRQSPGGLAIWDPR